MAVINGVAEAVGLMESSGVGLGVWLEIGVGLAVNFGGGEGVGLKVSGGVGLGVEMVGGAGLLVGELGGLVSSRGAGLGVGQQLALEQGWRSSLLVSARAEGSW